MGRNLRSDELAEDHSRCLLNAFAEGGDGRIEGLDDCFCESRETRVEYERFLITPRDQYSSTGVKQ